MNSSVDLTDLRSMTDGDAEMERALFAAFYASSEAAFNLMTDHCTDGPDEVWRANAHAIKGSAYNLGAKALGDLCRQAQENPGASRHEKQALLEKIASEYAAVKAILQTVHGSTDAV